MDYIWYMLELSDQRESEREAMHKDDDPEPDEYDEDDYCRNCGRYILDTPTNTLTEILDNDGPRWICEECASKR